MFFLLPDSAWANGNLAEAAGQLGNMVEHPNQLRQPNPGLQADGIPCGVMESIISCFPALMLYSHK